MTDKLHALPIKPDEMRAAVELIKRNLPVIVEHAMLMAKIRHEAYLAYTGEGFTPEQALELIKGSLI